MHAGHGLNYESAGRLSKIDAISEFNIGHFIIAESIFVGLKNSIKKFLFLQLELAIGILGIYQMNECVKQPNLMVLN